MSERNGELSEKTMVSLRTVGLLGSPVILGVVAGVGLLYQINNRLGSLEALARRGWTVDNQQIFVSEAQRRNPTLNLPSVAAVRSLSGDDGNK